MCKCVTATGSTSYIYRFGADEIVYAVTMEMRKYYTKAKQKSKAKEV